MQIASLHASIRRNRALRRAAHESKGTRAVSAFGAADMDFVSRDRLPGLGVHGLDACQTLLRRHDRRHIEQSKPRCFAGWSFNTLWIGDAFPQHLVAAA